MAAPNRFMTIEKIYLSEEMENPELDYSRLNTDVIVSLTNGHTYRANFIAIKKLVNKLHQYQRNQEKIAKKYFWTKNMVVVSDMKKEDLTPMIEYMIEEGDFQIIFEKL